MSDKNPGLGFYISPGPEDSWCLYNGMTDKNILFAVERLEIEIFLAMNCPNHPFISYAVETDYPLTLNTDMWAGIEYDKDSLLDPYRKVDYSILTETLKDLNTDYSYHNPFLITKGIEYPTSVNQLILPFVDKLKEEPPFYEEVLDDDIPLLPDDE